MGWALWNFAGITPVDGSRAMCAADEPVTVGRFIVFVIEITGIRPGVFTSGVGRGKGNRVGFSV